MRILSNWLTLWWDFIDTRGVVRRTILGASLWMVWLSGEHAYTYAMDALADGRANTGVAAVISAFVIPATTLVGYVFKSYVDSRTSS